jgi:nucleotide-binding universal stress UspA family protein
VKYERILVPLDGSSLAEGALSRPPGFLRAVAGEVVLLQAVGLPVGQRRDPRILQAAEDYLRTIERVLSAQDVRARSLVTAGAPADAILEAADRERASMIVMSTHGRTGLEKWTLGSVAEKVARAARVPVAVIRAFAPGGGRRVATIVVPQDGSDVALAAVPHAARIAKELGARIVLVHAFDDRRRKPEPEKPELPLERAAALLRTEGVEHALEFREGDAAHEVLEAAQALAADLIVMSTHGRTGPSRWVFGSVTEKVLRASPVPLVIVRGAS